MNILRKVDIPYAVDYLKFCTLSSTAPKDLEWPRRFNRTRHGRYQDMGLVSANISSDGIIDVCKSPHAVLVKPRFPEYLIVFSATEDYKNISLMAMADYFDHRAEVCYFEAQMILLPDTPDLYAF